MTRAILILAAVLVSTQAQAGRCALLENGAIKEFRVFDGACPNNPAGKPQFKWLPAPLAAVPSYDSEAQVLSGPMHTIEPNQVTQSYSVRNKTAQELDADKVGRVNAIADAVIRALCNHENRIRTVEVKPALSLAQCRDAFKALLP